MNNKKRIADVVFSASMQKIIMILLVFSIALTVAFSCIAASSDEDKHIKGQNAITYSSI